MLDTYLYAARNILRRTLGTRVNGEEIVHISTPTGGVGGQKNYVGLMYVGLEQESAYQAEAQGFSLEAGIIIMVYADFVDYPDSLQFLSLSMQCFQENLVLHPSAFPDLPLSNQIYVSPYFLPIEQQLQAWNPFSENMYPSMLYKLRSLRFKTVQVVAPPVSSVTTGLRETKP